MIDGKETYLGDGLYVSCDGFAFILRAPREGGDHWVALEPIVLIGFERYVADVRAAIKAEATTTDESAHNPTTTEPRTETEND